MERLTGFDLGAFVAASCERSGVPLKVSDSVVRDRVALLLSGRAVRSGAERQPDAGLSDSPNEIDTVRVKDRAALVGRGDHGTIQHGFDDGVLTGEVEFGPLSA